MSAVATPPTSEAMRRRDFPLAVGQLHSRDDGEPSREIAGTAVTYTERNSYWEVFVPGSFADSIAAKSDRKPLVMGYGHTDPIGRWSSFEETEEGLQVRGTVSDTSLGNDALTLIRDGALTGLSIGFYSLREQFADGGEEVTFDTPFGERTYTFDDTTFYVTEADVVEASVVMAPADDEARLNKRHRALRALPALGEASPREIEAEIMRLSHDEDVLPPTERRAIILRYAEALKSRENDVITVPVTVNVEVETGESAAEEAIEGETDPGAALSEVLDEAANELAAASDENVPGMLAEATGLTESDVLAVLDGSMLPTTDVLAGFAEVLGLDHDELVTRALGEGVPPIFEDDDGEVREALAGLRESVTSFEAKVRPTGSLESA